MATPLIPARSAYHGCCILLPTKHAKSLAIGPVLWQTLGACVIEHVVDTDQLGTFTGEVARQGTALECARRKCQLTLERLGSQVDFVLASEGSFGPHPHMPFMPCDQEILYFMDRHRDFHLHLSYLTPQTNYRMQAIDSLASLQKFAEEVRFPSHALIVRPDGKDTASPIFKGLNCQDSLEQAFKEAQKYSYQGTVWVETDMRAQFNPLRMAAIGQLAKKLADRLATHCPKCDTPGWGSVAIERGLPCQACHQATDLVSHEIFACVLCDYRSLHSRSDGLPAASPMHCAECNP